MTDVSQPAAADTVRPPSLLDACVPVAALIILATGLLSIFHPGFAFGGKWEAANWSPSAIDGVSISASNLLADIHGTAEYRANLVKVMAQRAVANAG